MSSELLARGLAQRGNIVRVITVADEESIGDKGGYEIRTVPSLNVYWDNRRPHSAATKVAWHALENFNPRALARMRREMQAFRPDLVVTVSIENINVATWLAARLERLPVAHVLHSYFLMCWRGSSSTRIATASVRAEAALFFPRARRCSRGSSMA